MPNARTCAAIILWAIEKSKADLADWDQVAAHQNHVQDAGGEDDDSDGGKLKEAKRRKTAVGEDAHGQDVGRGADERHLSAHQ